MSIWKKFAGLLFEENDAVVADDELEDISFPEEAIVYKKQTKTMKETSVKQDVERSFYGEEVPIKKQDVVQEPTKKFVSIEITDEKVEPVKEKDIRASRLAHATVVHEDKKEYEFAPVISPIFGSKDETVVEKGKSTIITLPKKKRDNPLGTVISPYFGLGELEEFKSEAQEELVKKEKSLLEEVPVEEIEQYEEEDDVNSISIDEIIVEKDLDEEEDDMMQISLFGDSTPLRESDEELHK